MSIAGNHLASIQGFPCKVGDALLVDFHALRLEVLLQRLDPAQHFLVGKSVKGPSERVQAGGVGEVRVREGGSHKVRRVSRGVATFVVGVDADVQPHELVELRVGVAKHAGEVARVVQALVLVEHPIVERAPVDERRDLRQLGKHVKDVLQRRLPEHRLGSSTLVRLGKLALRLAGHQRDGELGHRVHILAEAADQGLHVRRQFRTLVQLRGHQIHLLLGGHLSREKQPEQRLGQRLSRAARPFEGGQELLALGNGVAAEADPFLRIEVRGLPEHALDAASSADDLVDGDLTHDFGAMVLLEGLEVRLARRHLIAERVVEVLHTEASDGRLRGQPS
mmetsp:Transcript_781/g.3217  ORF Transcript_781/g.3217 Transcript_781/m.3217 type:complete len:336 (+) Transcript_781:585-1592(+)